MRNRIRIVGLLAAVLVIALGMAHYFSSTRDEGQAGGAPHAVGKSVELASKFAIHGLGEASPAPVDSHVSPASSAEEATRIVSQEPRVAPRTVRLDGQVITLQPNAASGFADDAAHGLGAAAAATDDIAHGFAPVAGVADDVGRGVGAAAGVADDVARGLAHTGPLKALGSALKWVLAPVIGGLAAAFAVRRNEPRA